jgi:hypothetical protein
MTSRAAGLVLSLLLIGRLAAATDGSPARLHTLGALRWGGDIQGEPYVSRIHKIPRGCRLMEIANGLAGRLGVRPVCQNDWQPWCLRERGD